MNTTARIVGITLFFASLTLSPSAPAAKALGLHFGALLSCADEIVKEVLKQNLSDDQLGALVKNTFAPRPGDKILYFTDIPATAGDSNSLFWQDRIRLVQDWSRRTARLFPLNPVSVVVFKTAGRNNGDLPANGYLYSAGDRLPVHCEEEGMHPPVPLRMMVEQANIVMAINEYSVTGLVREISKAKNFSRDFQAASMPGFHRGMIPALGIDYSQVQKFSKRIEGFINSAKSAELEFEVNTGAKGATYRLSIDLTGPVAASEGGVTHNMQNVPRVVNLPSGEAWRVPNESQEHSLTEGVMPLQLAGTDEVILLRLKKNRVVEVLSQGPLSEDFRNKITSEPLYGNLAEFGAGVLQPFNVEVPKIGPPQYPISNTLVTEKLFIHLALGMSKHLDGIVSGDDFKVRELMHHTDYVYLPSVQPKVNLKTVTLVLKAGESLDIVQEGSYVPFVTAP